MNKKLALSIVIAAFLLAGCAATGPKLLDSAEDIAGTWQNSVTSEEITFKEDGSWDLLIRSGSITSGMHSLEGTRYSTSDDFYAQKGAEIGIYEVELLENGNLKFILIEDDCPERVNSTTGGLIEKAEWVPVP